jgi:hypothetical protein
MKNGNRKSVSSRVIINTNIASNHKSASSHVIIRSNIPAMASGNNVSHKLSRQQNASLCANVHKLDHRKTILKYPRRPFKHKLLEIRHPLK